MAAFTRRRFLQNAAGATALLGAAQRILAAEPAEVPPLRWPVCVFVKFLQSLSFEDLARVVSEMGFQGIEATVRPKGQILPERAAEELPKLVDALKQQHLEVTILASNINRVDGPNVESVLRTAAALGIQRYRLEYYKYDLGQPVARQLENLKPIVRDLAALNQELGIQGIYQNHAGAGYVGASLWDLHELLEGIPVEQIAIAYDTRHSAVEAGLSWPVLWNLVQPHLGAVFVKNARWEGTKLKDVPLGEPGVAGEKFFSLFRESNFSGPISLHVEYLEKGSVDENLAAIRSDYAVLQKSLRG